MVVRTLIIQKDCTIAIGYREVTQEELDFLKTHKTELNIAQLSVFIHTIEEIKELFKTKIDSLTSSYLKTIYNIHFEITSNGYKYELKKDNKSVFIIKCETNMGCTDFILEKNGQILTYLDPKDNNLNRAIMNRIL